MEEEAIVTEISYKKISSPSQSSSKKKVQKKITTFIKPEPNLNSYSSVQSTIDRFLVTKPKPPFTPVDITRPSSINKKRGPGRPPKDPFLKKKVKTEQNSNIDSDEVIEIEVQSSENDNTGKWGTQ